MQLRKPLPLWFPVSLFLVTAAMIPLLGQARRRSVSEPQTVTKLTARLSRCTPPLHFVSMYPSRPEGPMWICRRPQAIEYLRAMVRDPSRVQAGRWNGIVFCEPKRGKALIDDEFIRDHWGECGMRIGKLLFFGDPDLLERIREAIIDKEEGKIFFTTDNGSEK